jgi:hypothetical protein
VCSRVRNGNGNGKCGRRERREVGVGEGKEGRARIFHGRLVEPPLGHVSLALSSHFPSVAAGSLNRV